MKNILYILIILLVAAVISAGTYALVESNSLGSATTDGKAPPTMTNANGDMPTIPADRRPEGGEHGTSSAGGFTGILILLAKVAGIAIVVTLFDKVFSYLQKLQVSQITG
jgi:hypothetical protein